MINDIGYEIASFNTTMGHLADQLLESTPVHIGEWQSTDVSQSQLHATYELTDVSLYMDIPESAEGLRMRTHPFVNKVWAEEHFAERVGGHPLNPPPSHMNWPWSRHNVTHQTGDQFSHTYPERMWPRHANNCHGSYAWAPGGDVQTVDQYGQGDVTHVCHGRKGIRFMYGDLSDLVDLLVRSPLTRQAYLPIWFPEDTGAVHRQRVPCTLGYHFMIRDGQLSCRYYMRSCDLIRHFADDLYLACRLTQWIVDQVNDKTNGGSYIDGVNRPGLQLQTGRLVMHISSLHAFVGDAYRLKELAG